MSQSRFLTAYIDLPFIERLIENKPDPMASSADSRPEIWQSVYRFIQRHARVVADVDQSVLESRPLIARFLLGGEEFRHVEIKPGVTHDFSEPENLPLNNPYTLFLLENRQLPLKDLQDQTGLLFLRYDDLRDDWLRLFDGDTIDVRRGAEPEFQWADLRKHGLPLNALVIVDKFAYRQFTENLFEENIGAILRALLPDQLRHRFHITLVMDFPKAYKKIQVTTLTPDSVYDTVEEYLSKNRPDLDVALTVASFGRGSGHKDRFIVTNYSCFHSNDSFDAIEKGKLVNETLITQSPMSEASPWIRPRLERWWKISNDPGYYISDDRKNKLLLGSGWAVNRLLESIPS